MEKITLSDYGQGDHIKEERMIFYTQLFFETLSEIFE